MFISTTLSFNSTTELSITQSSEKTIFFEAKNITCQSFEIRIQDDMGKTLFSEYALNPSTFERKYNLSELSDGKYMFLIEEDLQIQAVPILIENNNMKIDLEKLNMKL